jgi:alanyl-tRNA synthetase
MPHYPVPIDIDNLPVVRKDCNGRHKALVATIVSVAVLLAGGASGVWLYIANAKSTAIDLAEKVGEDARAVKDELKTHETQQDIRRVELYSAIAELKKDVKRLDEKDDVQVLQLAQIGTDLALIKQKLGIKDGLLSSLSNEQPDP